MAVKYEDKFYNHYQRREFQLPPIYSKHENFLMRFRACFERHEFIENATIVAFFKEGNGVFQKQGQQLNIKKDNFFVLNPNEGWKFLNKENSYMDVLSFGITTDFNESFSYYLNTEDALLLDDPFDSSEDIRFFLEKPLSSNHYTSGKLLKQIYHMSNDNEFEFLCPEELTIEILRSICKEQLLGNKMVSKLKVKKTSTKSETLKRLLMAYEFIHDNIQHQITIEQLSYVSSLSKFHLYDSFKKAFGKTPHQYINRLKISKAKEAIQKKGASIGEVSDSFGFSDLSVFSKVFKKTYGHSPSYYLEKNQYCFSR